MALQLKRNIIMRYDLIQKISILLFLSVLSVMTTMAMETGLKKPVWPVVVNRADTSHSNDISSQIFHYTVFGGT